jgi:hypothetical protein
MKKLKNMKKIRKKEMKNMQKERPKERKKITNKKADLSAFLFV